MDKNQEEQLVNQYKELDTQIHPASEFISKGWQTIWTSVVQEFGMVTSASLEVQDFSENTSTSIRLGRAWVGWCIHASVKVAELQIKGFPFLFFYI